MADVPHHQIDAATVLRLVACIATSLSSARREDFPNIELQASEELESPATSMSIPHWYDTEGPQYQSWRVLRPGWLYNPGPTGASA
eukprot:14734017-Heterocapsa_arctica.AAC.1